MYQENVFILWIMFEIHLLLLSFWIEGELHKSVMFQ